MMRRHVLQICLVAVLALGVMAGPALASSSWMFGTIDKIEEAEGGGRTVRLLMLIHNYKKGREHRVEAVTLPADVPVYLDWNRSTFAEALKPGRTLAFYTNHGHFADPKGNEIAEPFSGSRHGGVALVSTSPAPARPVAVGDKGCDLVVARLDGAGDFKKLAPDDKKIRADLRLMLEVTNGKITRGVAWTPLAQGARWHEMDASGLTLKGGNVTGTAKVAFLGTDGKRIDADYTLQPSEGGKEGFNGTFDGAEVSGRLAVSGQAVTPPGDDARLMLWTRHKAFGDRRLSYLVTTFEGGKADKGRTYFRKAGADGRVEALSLALKGPTLEGKLTAAKGDTTYSATVDGRLLGGYIVFATMKLEGADEPLRVYGFLMHPDAAAVCDPGGKH